MVATAARMILPAALVVIAVATAAADSVDVTVDPTRILARTTAALTSVTIDTCALKQQLDFGDPLLRALTAHLAPAVLRIGGTDQNSFSYDVSDTGMGQRFVFDLGNNVFC